MKFLDLTFSENLAEEIIRTVKHFSPDYICLGIRNIDNVDSRKTKFYLYSIKEKIINQIKKTNTKIIIGGSAVNIYPNRVFSYLDADYGIYGEGEESLNNLLDAIENKKDMSKIKGAIYKKSGQLIVNPIYRVKDLDTLKFQEAFKFVNIRKYLFHSGRMSIQTKRGCALNCAYCIYKKIEGRKIRLRNPKLVVQEIYQIINKEGIMDFEFTDSVFNHPAQHAKSICKEIIKSGIVANFSTSGINPRFLDMELLTLMEKAGFNEISISPESASQKVLDGLKKEFKKDAVKKSALLLNNSKINVIWYFMFGGPNETNETACETIRFIRNKISKKHLVLLVSGIRIFKNTEMEKIAVKEEIIKKDSKLFFPEFYFSRYISRNALTNDLKKLVKTNPNCLLLDENHFSDMDRLFRKILEILFSIIKIKDPSWKYLIIYRVFKARISKSLYNLIQKNRMHL